MQAWTLFVVAAVIAATATASNTHNNNKWYSATVVVTAPTSNTQNKFNIHVVHDSRMPNQQQEDAVDPLVYTNSYCTVTANFTQNVTGWDVIDVSPNRTTLYSDPVTTYTACGVAEGSLTWESILANNWSTQAINLGTTQNVIDGTNKWIQDQIEFLDNYNGPDTYILAISQRWMAYLRGLVTGINDSIAKTGSQATPWKLFDIFSFNLQAELGDILAAVQLQNYSVFDNNDNDDAGSKFKDFSFHLKNRREARRAMHVADPSSSSADARYLHGEHCSALLKIAEDGSDVFIAHTTWSGLSSMLRQYKTFNFETTVSQSTAPGWISSQDDWYTTGFDLIILETTFSQYNQSLIKQYVVPATVPEFIRIIAASVFSASGEQFADLYLRGNSGTYCNSWFVLDMKLISASDVTKKQLAPNAFWYLEQLPGQYSRAADLTSYLNAHGYFASYNQPFFNEVYISSGNAALVAANGGPSSWGSIATYAGAPRAKIFARNQTQVDDFGEFVALMRYNGYGINDPLSALPNCTTCNPRLNPNIGISNRADLTSPTQTYGDIPMDLNFFPLAAFGGIDVKSTSWRRWITQHVSTIQSGPTRAPIPSIYGAGSSDTLPVFDWDKLDPKIPRGLATRHRMQPIRFDFDFVNVTTTTAFKQAWPLPSPPPANASEIFMLEGQLVSPHVGVKSGALCPPRRNNNNNSVPSSEYSIYTAILGTQLAPQAKLINCDLDPRVGPKGDALTVFDAGDESDPTQQLAVNAISISQSKNTAESPVAYAALSSVPWVQPGIVNHLVLPSARIVRAKINPRLIRIGSTTSDDTILPGGAGNVVGQSFIDDFDKFYFVTHGNGSTADCVVSKYQLRGIDDVGPLNLVRSTQVNLYPDYPFLGAGVCAAAAYVAWQKHGLFMPACYNDRDCVLIRISTKTMRELDRVALPYANSGRASIEIDDVNEVAFVGTGNVLLKISLSGVQHMKPMQILAVQSDIASFNGFPIALRGEYLYGKTFGEIPQIFRVRKSDLSFDTSTNVLGTMPGVFISSPFRSDHEEIFYATASSRFMPGSGWLLRIGPGDATLAPTSAPTPAPISPSTPTPGGAPTLVFFKVLYPSEAKAPDTTTLSADIRALLKQNKVCSDDTACTRIGIKIDSRGRSSSGDGTYVIVFTLFPVSSPNDDSLVDKAEALLESLPSSVVALALNASSFSFEKSTPSPNSNNGASSNSGGLSGGAIAGIAVGCIFGVAALMGGFWYFTRASRGGSDASAELLTQNGGGRSSDGAANYNAVNQQGDSEAIV